MKYKTLFMYIVCFLFANEVLRGQSPRLFLPQEKMATLKEAINKEGTHHHQLFSMIKARVDNGNLDQYGGDKNNYRRSYQAVENALTYQLTDDTTYAQQAYELLIEMYTSGDEGTPTIPDTGNYDTKTPGSKALTYAFPSMAYGICYDWARSGWNTAQTDTVMSKIQEGLDDWEALFRWELYDMPVSNWVSVCRSAEMIMMLGAGEEQNRAKRYDTLKYLLNLHYDLAYGPSAYSNEGIGYIHYGVPFAYAANYAALSVGDSGLVRCFEGKTFDRLLMYTFAFTDDKKHLMTSVDSHYPFGEGLFGLVMGNLDSTSLAYYKYFYDHHLGIRSGIDESEKFDQNRLGAVWNLLYYPTDVEDTNPSDKLNYCLADNEFGAYFIRSRWKNENDILFNVMGKYSYHRKGWQDAETFNIGLVAFGEQFFGGPGKGADDPNYSSLLVDGTAKASSKHTGEYHFFEEKKDEVYIIVGGGSKYTEMGLSNAERHVFIKFLNDTSAVIATMDVVNSGSTHAYRWQLNTGHEDGDAGVSTQLDVDQGLPSFTMHGKDKGTVKGWYLTNKNLDFQGHDPLFLQTLNKKSDTLWVVMHVGLGEIPDVLFYNEGIKTVMEIDNKYLHFNKDSNRLEMSEIMPVHAKTVKNRSECNVYPVPADRKLNLDLSSSTDSDINIQILNMTGQILFKKHLKTANRFLSIDTSGLPNGMYQFVLKDRNGMQVKPLLINHP